MCPAFLFYLYWILKFLMKSLLHPFLFFLTVFSQNSFAQSKLNIEKMVSFENFINDEIKRKYCWCRSIGIQKQ